MCGIVGVVSNTQIEDRAWLASARDSLRSRGPDFGGEWWADNGLVGLAHRRLSIIDLSAAGHQPMLKPKVGLAIVFNGEIYNFRELRDELKHLSYRFNSSGDTEVILAAYEIWGTDCLSRLNGMFSFAIFDARRRLLFVARDRAGEKPLFYHLDKGTLHFGSELKALLMNPILKRRINLESLDCYLNMGYVPGERCILEGFNKLPAAHAMVFDVQSGEVNTWRYWSLPEVDLEDAPDAVDEEELLDELEYLLEDSVRRQLVADVPVGVLLSGGVDSSLITAMAMRVTSNVQTFTIGFPEHATLDETDHARLISRHFGTRHTELMAEPATANLLPQLARQFDEPLTDSSMIPTFLVSQLVGKSCKVALGGDGGDELFGGYGHHSRLLKLQKFYSWMPWLVRKGMSKLAGDFIPLGFAGGNIRTWIQALELDLKAELPLIASYFDAKNRQQLMAKHSDWKVAAEAICRESVPINSDLLQRSTRWDFANYLAEDILVKVDRASMLNSLEVRAPILDQRLIEFAFGKVPSRLKANSDERKILLKRLSERLLPREFDRQRKQGFSIPLAAWLKDGPFLKLFLEVLLDTDCLFDRVAVKELISGQKRGRNNGERLFGLVLFELWRKEYSVTL